MFEWCRLTPRVQALVWSIRSAGRRGWLFPGPAVIRGDRLAERVDHTRRTMSSPFIGRDETAFRLCRVGASGRMPLPIFPPLDVLNQWRAGTGTAPAVAATGELRSLTLPARHWFLLSWR